MIRENRRSPPFAAVALAATVLASGEASGATPRFPEPPPPGEHLLDDVGVLGGPAVSGFDARGRKLLEETGTPLYFVVLASTGDYGATASAGWTVSRYARAMFLDWSLRAVGARSRTGPSAGKAEGSKTPEAAAVVPPAFPEKGVLVLVSLRERRVAVETGPHWYPQIRDARNIARRMAAYLDEGETAVAIDIGVASVEKLAQGRAVGRPGGHGFAIMLGIVFVAALITTVSYLRQGGDSPVCRFWVSVFSALGAGITVLLRRGVDIGASLAGGKESETDRSRISVGQW